MKIVETYSGQTDLIQIQVQREKKLKSDKPKKILAKKDHF